MYVCVWLHATTGSLREQPILPQMVGLQEPVASCVPRILVSCFYLCHLICHHVQAALSPNGCPRIEYAAVCPNTAVEMGNLWKSVIPQRITSSNSVQILGRDQQSLDVLIAQLQLEALCHNHPQQCHNTNWHKPMEIVPGSIRQTSHSKCSWPLHCHRNEDPTATQQHLKMLKISQDAQVK